MAFCCDILLWTVGLYVLYKVLDWLIRIPRVSRPDQKYVMVTGCDTGFGHEISKRLDSKGVNVIAGCLTEKGENELAKVCSSRLKTVRLDVANPESVRAAYEEVEKHIPGDKGLHALLNNAGIAGKIGPCEWLQLKDYHQVFNVNLLGLIDTTVTFLPLLKKAKGRVINTASVFGRYALTGSNPYTISKYGVESFSDTLRRQMKDFRVKVSLIEPGFHKTNITNSEGLARSLTESFEQAPKHVQDEYGREFLEKSIEAILKRFVSGVISENISDVVDAYEHAILGQYPRARYVVGRDAKFVWLPLQWMPEWLGDRIVGSLQKNRPRPAALQRR